MAQRRFVDRGRPYDHEAWRGLYRTTMSPGVYSGYTLSPSSISASQIVISPGAVLLPTGIVVVEDHEVSIQIDGVFPPSTATSYTVKTYHREIATGLIGGEAMIYLVEASLVTAQPSDGVILGWIRHPGGGVALDQSHITNAPKYAPSVVASDCAARMPVVAPAPLLVTTLGTGVSHDEGFSTNQVWRGFSNPSTATDPITLLTPVAISYWQYPLYARPWQVSIRSIVPIGDQIEVSIHDSTGIILTTATISSHTAWQVDTIQVPASGGTFTAGSKGTIKLISTVSQGTTVKVADISVNFWPYALPQF
jgi:hypothetical protein